MHNKTKKTALIALILITSNQALEASSWYHYCTQLFKPRWRTITLTALTIIPFVFLYSYFNKQNHKQPKNIDNNSSTEPTHKPNSQKNENGNKIEYTITHGVDFQIVNNCYKLHTKTTANQTINDFPLTTTIALIDLFNNNVFIVNKDKSKIIIVNKDKTTKDLSQKSELHAQPLHDIKYIIFHGSSDIKHQSPGLKNADIVKTLNTALKSKDYKYSLDQIAEAMNRLSKTKSPNYTFKTMIIQVNQET